MNLSVTTSANAGELERFAAAELRRYARELFGPQPEPEPAAGGPDLAVSLRVSPDLATQAFRIERAGPGRLEIAGGSGASVLWGVYELVERWGVTFLLHGDAPPADPGPLWLPDGPIRGRPRLAARAWRVVNAFPMGPESWPLHEYRRFIDQCAKLKFNRLLFSFWPWHPYVDYSFRGTRKRSAYSSFDDRFPVRDDMVGRGLFGVADQYENPHLRPATRYEDRVAIAQQLARDVMAHARARGMDVAIEAQPTEFPKEFQHLAPGAAEVRQYRALTFGLGPDQLPDDPNLVGLARAALRAHVEPYPDASLIFVGMPEHRGPAGLYARAFERLDRKYGLGDIRPLQETLRLASERVEVASGGAARQVGRVKGDLVTLAFLDRVLEDPATLARGDGRAVRLGYAHLAEELLAYVPRLRPVVAETLNFVDYTAGRVFRQRGVLDRIPSDPPANLVLTLADDNVGLLPQVTTDTACRLTREIADRGWHGFATRFWLLGDLDPVAACVARAAWDRDVVAADATRRQVRRVAGARAEVPLARALGIVEEVTRRLDDHGIGFGFPVPGMLLKHWDGRPLAPAFGQDRDDYARALRLARAARRVCQAGGERYVDYHVGRLAFAVDYLRTVGALHNASLAHGQGDRTGAARLTREALGQLRRSIEAWAGVARDGSDLGAIAMLNALAYWPLREHLAGLGRG